MDVIFSPLISLFDAYSEFTPESAKKIFGSPVTKHVLFFTDKKADHHQSTLETFRTVASSYKGSLNEVCGL